MSKKSFDKKKKREKEVKAKILSRRTALREEEKKKKEEDNEKRQLQKQINKLEGRTIVNKKKDTVSQLEHNLAILEELEKEQKRLTEMQENSNLLNMEGVPVQESKTGLGASADVKFYPKISENQ